MMRQKRLGCVIGCVYMQDLSSWLLVNQRGVSGGADVTKFLEGGSCHDYSECNRVLQVDKRVSTEMSVSFCGLTCDFSKKIPLMVERKY